MAQPTVTYRDGVAYLGEDADVGDCIALDQCLACGGTNLTPYLDLGFQPLANAFVAEPETLALYPLGLNVCKDCWHSQQRIAVDPHVLYDNYAYASGTSATLRRYFAEFVWRVEGDFDVGSNTSRSTMRSLRVLDIASNDGSLLRAFNVCGHDARGVEPAENLAKEANAQEMVTYVGFWDAHMADRVREHDSAEAEVLYDVIVVMNVLGHTADPLTFLQLCKRVLAPGGRIYVQTSQAHMVENCEFDTVYAEHLSFFTASSFVQIAKRAGLSLAALEEVDIHGGSYLVTLVADEKAHGYPSLHTRLDYEQARGVYDLITYEHFQQRVKDRLDLTRHAITLYRAGRKVVAYGAAAKAMTFLNALLPAFRHEQHAPITYVVDDAPLKQGTRCPGSGIPVLGPDVLDDEPSALLIIVTAWNFEAEIRERVKARRSNPRDVFLTYFPTLNVRG